MSNQPKCWYALDITADPLVSDAVEGVLNEFDVLGIEIDQLRKKADEDLIITGYFSESPNLDLVRESLKSAVVAFQKTESSIRRIESREVFEEDWLAEWKKHWRATEIRRFIIAPPWEHIDRPDKIVIRIEPNMAFGTGTHETTRLCLDAISELYRAPGTVLDVGTGTGILAIAAAKLGSDQIDACDTDVDSIKIARENAVLNEAGNIDFSVGTLGTDGPEYDFVCANLTWDVIEPMLENLLARSKGILILSGILGQQESEVTRALRNLGINDAVVHHLGEWISVVVRK